MERDYKFLISYILVVCFSIVAILGYIIIFYPIKYKAEIIEYSQEFGLRPEIIASMINAESNFKYDAISKVGAIGLMQLMPSTAEEMAQKLDLEGFTTNSLYIPEINIRLGCAYLSYLLERFNDLDTSICAYNAGPNKVSEWLLDKAYSEDGKTLQTTPYKATNFYLSKIKQKCKIYTNFF